MTKITKRERSTLKRLYEEGEILVPEGWTFSDLLNYLQTEKPGSRYGIHARQALRKAVDQGLYPKEYVEHLEQENSSFMVVKNSERKISKEALRLASLPNEEFLRMAKKAIADKRLREKEELDYIRKQNRIRKRSMLKKKMQNAVDKAVKTALISVELKPIIKAYRQGQTNEVRRLLANQELYNNGLFNKTLFGIGTTEVKTEGNKQIQLEEEEEELRSICIDTIKECADTAEKSGVLDIFRKKLKEFDSKRDSNYTVAQKLKRLISFSKAFQDHIGKYKENKFSIGLMESFSKWKPILGNYEYKGRHFRPSARYSEEDDDDTDDGIIEESE